MKYPTEITIRGYTYRIEYVENQREVDRDFESDDYLGTCCSWTQVVRVFAKQSQLGILSTLIHELLHAIFRKSKMLPTALKSKAMEELFISAFADELAEILLENKLVVFPKQGPPITTRIVRTSK